MTIDVARALEEGAGNIDRCGHLKNALGDSERGFCAVGSFLRCDYIPTEICRIAYHALGAMVGGSVEDWNDAPERTAAEVTATMRACAAIWRAKHEERQSEAVTEPSAEKVRA